MSNLPHCAAVTMEIRDPWRVQRHCSWILSGNCPLLFPGLETLMFSIICYRQLNINGFQYKDFKCLNVCFYVIGSFCRAWQQSRGIMFHQEHAINDTLSQEMQYLEGNRAVQARLGGSNHPAGHRLRSASALLIFSRPSSLNTQNSPGPIPLVTS